jgi:hypothetical protein
MRLRNRVRSCSVNPLSRDAIPQQLCLRQVLNYVRCRFHVELNPDITDILNAACMTPLLSPK